eukprot:7022356-Pyramimonas_sp.AAC.1
MAADSSRRRRRRMPATTLTQALYRRAPRGAARPAQVVAAQAVASRTTTRPCPRGRTPRWHRTEPLASATTGAPRRKWKSRLPLPGAPQGASGRGMAHLPPRRHACRS